MNATMVHIKDVASYAEDLVFQMLTTVKNVPYKKKTVMVAQRLSTLALRRRIFSTRGRNTVSKKLSNLIKNINFSCHQLSIKFAFRTFLRSKTFMPTLNCNLQVLFQNHRLAVPTKLSIILPAQGTIFNRSMLNSKKDIHNSIDF